MINSGFYDNFSVCKDFHHFLKQDLYIVGVFALTTKIGSITFESCIFQDNYGLYSNSISIIAPLV